MTTTSLPKTVIELCDYINLHKDRIYIREQNESGKWGAYSLTELPSSKAIHHALRFVAMGIIPSYVVEEEQQVVK
jgi:hypothetical protein